jgi:type I restriction enzyme S subunit
MLQSCQLHGGDIVVSMMGTVGKCAIIPEGIEPGIMDSHLLRLQIDAKKFSKNFLRHLISDSALVKRQIKQLSVGGIMEGLSSNIVKKLRFPCPPLSEQKKIAEILSTVDKIVENEITHEKGLEKIRKALMQVLLTGKVRVKN